MLGFDHSAIYKLNQLLDKSLPDEGLYENVIN